MSRTLIAGSSLLYRQIYEAGKHCWELKQIGIFLLAYFLIQETLSTTGTVAGILQNE